MVNDDGSLSVTEALTFDFSGDFSGAYRDIPLEPGQEVSSVTVSDESVTYQPGGCTELGCSSPPGTFGVADLGDTVRIVWHHSSFDESRVFTITYDMTGLAVAYNDVVDVNLKVWGDQWAVGLDQLHATMDLPGTPTAGDVRVWGHPFDVDGSTSLGDDEVSPSLEAFNIPAEQWVEMRVVFPKAELASTAGAVAVASDGLESILAEEATLRRRRRAGGSSRADRPDVGWRHRPAHCHRPRELGLPALREGTPGRVRPGVRARAPIGPVAGGSGGPGQPGKRHRA